MAKLIVDWIQTQIELEQHQDRAPITYQEWCDIRRNGTPEEIEEAVERMIAAGGYDNLV